MTSIWELTAFHIKNVGIEIFLAWFSLRRGTWIGQWDGNVKYADSAGVFKFESIVKQINLSSPFTSCVVFV